MGSSVTSVLSVVEGVHDDGIGAFGLGTVAISNFPQLLAHGLS